MICYPGSSSGRRSCCYGWRRRSYATNGLAVPTRDAAPPAAKAGWSRHLKPVVVVLTGDDKTTDVVVNIFNKVNSGGTKLSQGDLTLARICAHWPEARSEMQERLEKWKANGFDADLDWLLRCVTAVVAGGSEYQRLERVEIPLIKENLRETGNAVDHLLEAMRSHLYMDTDRVFTSKQAFPVMVKYLVKHGGRFPNQSTMAKILHWYFTVAIWGRFSGATETVINQDLAALQGEDPIELLRHNIRESQGERSITHDNFNVNYTKSRFYPLLYVMSRVQDARDWGTGNQLRHHSLGAHTNLEMHHIFPRAYLRRNGVAGSDANNIGNIAFQTGKPTEQLATGLRQNICKRLSSVGPGRWNRSGCQPTLSCGRSRTTINSLSRAGVCWLLRPAGC